MWSCFRWIGRYRCNSPPLSLILSFLSLPSRFDHDQASRHWLYQSSHRLRRSNGELLLLLDLSPRRLTLWSVSIHSSQQDGFIFAWCDQTNPQVWKTSRRSVQFFIDLFALLRNQGIPHNLCHDFHLSRASIRWFSLALIVQVSNT